MHREDARNRLRDVSLVGYLVQLPSSVKDEIINQIVHMDGHQNMLSAIVHVQGRYATEVSKVVQFFSLFPNVISAV